MTPPHLKYVATLPCNLSLMVCFADTNVSQGSVAIDEIFDTPTRSTQPCIPPGSLNRVPASAGVTAGMLPLPGGR